MHGIHLGTCPVSAAAGRHERTLAAFAFFALLFFGFFITALNSPSALLLTLGMLVYATTLKRQAELRGALAKKKRSGLSFKNADLFEEGRRVLSVQHIRGSRTAPPSRRSVFRRLNRHSGSWQQSLYEWHGFFLRSKKDSIAFQ